MRTGMLECQKNTNLNVSIHSKYCVFVLAFITSPTRLVGLVTK